MSNVNSLYYGSADSSRLPEGYIANTTLTPQEEEMTRRVYQIVLLKIKTCILKNLKNEDIPEFEKVITSKKMSEILVFARARIPNLVEKINSEIEPFIKQLHLASMK